MLAVEKKRFVSEVKASQAVRLFADGFIAIYLIYLARKGTVTKTDATILIIIAIVTIGYNIINYQKNK